MVNIIGLHRMLGFFRTDLGPVFTFKSTITAKQYEYSTLLLAWNKKMKKMY